MDQECQEEVSDLRRPYDTVPMKLELTLESICFRYGCLSGYRVARHRWSTLTLHTGGTSGPKGLQHEIFSLTSILAQGDGPAFFPGRSPTSYFNTYPG